MDVPWPVCSFAARFPQMQAAREGVSDDAEHAVEGAGCDQGGKLTYLRPPPADVTPRRKEAPSREPLSSSIHRNHRSGELGLLGGAFQRADVEACPAVTVISTWSK